MLNYFGSTHCFIHCKLAKAPNCFIYLTLEFQLMIAYGGHIIFLGKYHKITLTMGEHILNSPMIYIMIGGVDVVLGVQWLESLVMVSFNFQKLFIKFSLDGK